MRVTQSAMLKNQAAALSAAYVRLFGVQSQVSSGRRLQKPSDDPAAVRSALDVRAGRSRLAQVRSNAGLASSELANAEGMLRNATDLIARARELAVQGANGTLAPSDREALASEVDELLAQLLTIANGQGAQGFLFAGGAHEVEPFEKIVTSSGTFVRYRGDEGATTIDLGDRLGLELNVPGSRVFGGGARGATIWSGVTGAAAGAGNDNAVGSDRVVVAHVQTTLGDGLLGGTGDSGSGLQVGASSAAGDTVLGAAGAWSIALVDTSGTGASGTVSLDGGPPVAWTAGDGDLVVTAPGGEVVHLDLTGVTAGFNGTVSLAASGTLSLDGGLTTTAIDFARDDQIVVDSESGGSIFVDSRTIRRTGTEVLRFPGTYDLFGALIELRDALANRDGDPLDVQLDRVRAMLPELERGGDVLLAALSTYGSRMRLVDSTLARAAEVDLILAADQARLEDTDYTAASIELSQAELTLQAGIALASRIAQLPTLVQLL
jgi:flagellar hook-associated protein 3 FlgL